LLGLRLLVAIEQALVQHVDGWLVAKFAKGFCSNFAGAELVLGELGAHCRGVGWFEDPLCIDSLPAYESDEAGRRRALAGRTRNGVVEHFVACTVARIWLETRQGVDDLQK